MIKCNRCGKMTPAGTVCQACGAPLAGMVNNGPAQGMGFQDQPELPAWLESLRAGERPAAPPTNNNAPGFSPADLVDDGALPSWMRSERGDSRDNTAANLSTSAQPAPFPAQAGAGGVNPPQGITAQSLIDEKSLPSWMQEGTPSGGTSPQPTPGGFAASSLVQPDNVPDWMRSLQPPPAAAKPDPAPAAPKPQPRPAEPPAAPAITPGFSARDLVDQQSLPSWMQPQNESGTKEKSSSSSMPSLNQAPQAAAGGQNGFSARDLVDQQSLPSWMQPQNESGAKEKSSSSSMPSLNQTPQAAMGGQSGFSASSLLDVDSLPSWLREGGQGSGQQPRVNNNPMPPTPQQPAWPAQSPVSSGSSWPAAGGQTPSGMQAPFANATPQQGGGPLSAASFIDPNSLPEWLRSSGGQPANPGQSQGTGSRPGGYGTPRGDNMRVPSRPRGEVNPSESSELAANVFASMLGVASATPNYPAQPQGDQPGQPPAFGQTPSGVQTPYGAQGQAGASNPYAQLSQPDPTGYASLGQPGMPNAGSMPNTPMGSGGVFPQNYGAGINSSGVYGNNYPGGSQGQNNPAMGANPSMGSQTGMNAGSPYAGNAYGSQASSASPDSTSDQKSNKKRGLFEAIREWLSR